MRWARAVSSQLACHGDGFVQVVDSTSFFCGKPESLERFRCSAAAGGAWAAAELQRDARTGVERGNAIRD
jgi:hypothetical protein